MRTLQRFAVLVAIGAIVGTMAACSGGTAVSSAPSAGPTSAGETTAPSEASAPTTISFWTHTHPPMIEVYEKLIADYEAANPNITVDYQTIPNNEFGTKMLTSLS